jgi:release factor glutamine methyltransferase
MTIAEITNKYKGKLDYLDREILIAHSLGKTREFVLTYPNHEISKSQISNLKLLLKRRVQKESIAHILGHKEFYGLDFIVNKDTLIPRPETEMMVEEVVILLRNMLRSKITILDVGTGSGCIIVSIANLNSRLRGNDKVKYFASDISKEALKIAKKNSKQHNLTEKITFLQGDLFLPFLKNKKLTDLKVDQLIITANLPYLSKEIYQSAPLDVKKYEPKSALYSPELGLQHYRKLLEQLKLIPEDQQPKNINCLLEISPEQKKPLTKLIKDIFPAAEIEFKKDLANKWRICKININ